MRPGGLCQPLNISPPRGIDPIGSLAAQEDDGLIQGGDRTTTLFLLIRIRVLGERRVKNLRVLSRIEQNTE